MNVDVIKDELIIRIKVKDLLHAITHSPDYSLSHIIVTNKEEFMKELVCELQSEDETGATIIHRMFDEAANNAIENGASGVEYDE